MRRLAFLTACSVMAVALAAVLTTSSHIVQADHDEEVTDHVPVLTANYRPDTFGFGQARPVGPDDEGFYRGGVPAILRQLVTAGRGMDRTPIDVCAHADYVEYTRKAVAVWNDGLESLGATPILKFREPGTANSTPATCPQADLVPTSIDTTIAVHWQPTSVIVVPGDCAPGQVACADPDRLAGHPWYSYAGKGTVSVVKSVFDNLSPPLTYSIERKKTATIAHEIGHLLGFIHLYQPVFHVKNPDDSLTYYEVNKCPGELEYQQVNVHRTRATRYTDDEGNRLPLYTRPRDIPNISDRMRQRLEAITASEHGGAMMLPSIWCAGDDRKTAHEWGYDNPVALTAYDKNSFQKAYGPGKIDGLRVSDAFEAGKVIVSWDPPGDVHAEKSFAVQLGVYYTPSTNVSWRTIENAPANASSITITKPTDNPNADRPYTLLHGSFSEATFRIVSVTDAFGTRAPRAEAISSLVGYLSGTATPPSSGGPPGSGQQPGNDNGDDDDDTSSGMTVCSGTRSLAMRGQPSSAAAHATVSGHQSMQSSPVRWVYDCGDTATITAAATIDRPAGYRDKRFSRWGGSCTGQTGTTCTVVMDRNRSVTAIYEDIIPPGTVGTSSRQSSVTTYNWSASCTTNSSRSSGSGYATLSSARFAADVWATNSCGGLGRVTTTLQSSSYTTWSWAASCTIGPSGGGSGFSSSSAALSAGYAWVGANCTSTHPDEPVEPTEVTVTADANVVTFYRWNASCTIGTRTGTGTATTRSAARSAGTTWLTSTCSSTATVSASSSSSSVTQHRYTARCNVGTGRHTSGYTYSSAGAARNAAYDWIDANCPADD